MSYLDRFTRRLARGDNDDAPVPAASVCELCGEAVAYAHTCRECERVCCPDCGEWDTNWENVARVTCHECASPRCVEPWCSRPRQKLHPSAIDVARCREHSQSYLDSLRPQLTASVTLAKIEGALRGIADTIHDEAVEREGYDGHRDDVLYGWEGDVREVVRLLERWKREELKTLLEWNAR